MSNANETARQAAPDQRYARFVLLRDRDGRKFAVARQAVGAMCEGEDGGTTLLLSGGRVIVVDAAIEDVATLFG